MVDTSSTRNSIREFIIENFLMGDASGLPSDSASFLENGIIDSTGVLEVVSFLEEKFSLKVDDADLLPENLDSVDRLVNYVTRKLKA